VTVIDVVLPTLAVVLSWASVGAMLAGCGLLTRRALLALLSRSPAGGLARADLWIGLAVLVAYLQIWNLYLSISWYAWIVPVVAGLAGLAGAARRFRGFRIGRLSMGVIALTGLGILWLANRALAAAEDYDLGLYHLGAIGYALQYPTLPGLGNLQGRLAASDAHLLFAAFLDHGPWARTGFHLANGLLVTMLFVDLGSRFALRTATPRAPSFTGRMALLLVPAAIVVAGIRPSHRLSSPNLDLAAFVLVAVGALYLAECVERGFPPTAILTATSSFALASVTRPLYWLSTVFAAGLIVVAAGRAHEKTQLRIVRSAALSCTLPGVLLIGWMGRQALLSGYPLLPTMIGALPADWRVPASVIRAQNRGDDAWARWPGIDPQVVLSSWHWLTAWWLARRARDPDIVAPLILLACLAPSLLGRGTKDAERAKRMAPMLAVLVPALSTLIAWFLIAPDPRFAFAPIWLVPIALAAWALPTTNRRPPGTMLVPAAVALGGFVVLGIEHIAWLTPAALASWALATAIARLWRPGRSVELLAYAAVLSVALAPIGVIADGGAFRIVVSNHDGPFGTPLERNPAVVSFVTASGLRVSQPVGTDQCFLVTLCTQDSNTRLRLRGARISDGFTVSP
jgi:hypothetical protein